MEPVNDNEAWMHVRITIPTVRAGMASEEELCIANLTWPWDETCIIMVSFDPSSSGERAYAE